MVKVIFYSFLFIPVIYLLIGISTGSSIFANSTNFKIFEGKDKTGAADTRTFLYFETFNDLTKNKALLLGKGMTGGIATKLPKTIDPTIKNGKRQFLEVSFLEYMRRGGILYTCLNYLIIVFAAYYPLKHGKNNIVLLGSVAIMIYYLTSFVGHSSLFSLHFVFLWITIGICSSKQWNKLSNEEIKQLLFFQKKHIKIQRSL